MNLLFINLSKVYGGGEVYLREIINDFVYNKTYKNIYFAGENPNQFFNDLNIPNESKVYICNKYNNLIKMIKIINKIIKDKNINCVILNGNRAIYIAPFINKGTKKVCIRHVMLNANNLLRRILSFYFGKLATMFIDKVIVISDTHKSELLKRKFCKKNKIETIYNGVDLDHFKRETLYNKTEIITITEIARIEYLKGQQDLIIAFNNLYKKNKNIRLWLVGDGSYKEEIVNLIEKLSLIDVVTMWGFQGNVKEILENTDIFVLPSYTEGLPISIIEAMAMNIPVIATKVGAVHELVIDKITGLLVEPKEISNLEDCIDKLIKNPQKRVEMGLKGHERAKQLFDKKIMIKKINNIIRELSK